MIKLGVAWRILAWTKRAALALERIASANERIANVQESNWQRENIRPKPRPMVFGEFNRVEADKEWERRRLEGEVARDEE